MKENCNVKKMTILYMSSFELPDKDAASHRVVNNAKILRELGYNIVFIDTDAEQKSRIVKKELCFGFERWSIRKSMKYLYSIREQVEVAEMFDDLAAIIVYNHPAIGLWKLRRYCDARGIRLIADATEWYAAVGPNCFHRFAKWLDTSLRMRILHFKCDGIIVISRFLENYYKKVETVYLPPLVDCHDKKWDISVEKAQDGVLRIIYAGSPEKHKDKLNLILDALKDSDSDSFDFRVVGLTQEQYLAYYPKDKQLICLLNGSVTFLGRKSHEEVLQELKKADFSLFYREQSRVTKAGFPTKFGEAITCGTPVLTNKNSDLQDFLKEGINGFWIDDLSNDLKRVLRMDIRKIKMMRKGIDVGLFDYRNKIDVVEEFIARVLKE